MNNENERGLEKFYSPGQMTDYSNAGGMSTAVRAMKEVEAQVILAKKFPRDENLALKKIERACSRPDMAKTAQYNYPKGKKDGKPQMVSGPSIRLAEVLAQAWGNLDFGVREIAQDELKKESVVEAYCWDLETNTRQTKVFTVRHRIKVAGAYKDLEDPRDIYELAANMGARRMRACILGVLPPDVVDFAESVCEKTLRGENGKPIEDRIRDLVRALDKECQVSLRMIENFLGHPVAEMNGEEFTDMYKIYNSIKDRVTKRADWFDVKEDSPASDDLKTRMKAAETAKTNESQNSDTDKAKALDPIVMNVNIGDRPQAIDDTVKKTAEKTQHSFKI